MSINTFGRRLSLAILFASGAAALAQSSVDGAIAGTIQDKSGSVIPGAAITIHSNGTNAEQTATADTSGFFRVVHLQPGSYTVTITSPGFQTYRSPDVVVQVGQLTNVDAGLPVGGASETVEVTGALPSINTTSPDFANVIDLEVLGNLPVNNYRWSSYALLTPGVVADSNGFGLLSFRGQSTLQNNVSLDGADDNQAFFAEERGRTRAGYSTAQSSIQEFQVNTSNYSVEYGRAVGGVVNSITKSGTNKFHGDLYFQDRDAGWGAFNPYTRVARQDPSTGAFNLQSYKPKDWRKQYGGSVGGPIFKDRLFFFVAVDKYKRNFPGTAVASNPTSFFATPDATLPAGTACNGTKTATSAGNGIGAPSTVDAAICTLAGNLAGTSGSAATAAQYAAAQPRYVSGLVGLNTVLGPVARNGDQNILFPKLDWQINQRNHASFEINRLNWNSPAGIQTQATNTFGIRSFGNDFVKLTFGIAKLDTTITPSLVNQIRYQYGRDFEYEFSQQPTPYEQTNLLTPPGYTNPNALAPSVTITNGFNFGTPTFLQRGRYPDERRFQIADTANFNRGHHNVKFGIDYLHTDDLTSNLRFQFGSLSYNNLQSYLTDLYQSQTPPPPGLSAAATAVYGRHYNNFQQSFGPQGFHFTTQDYGIFVQDEWKVAPRLSLTLGARYDYEALPAPYAGVVNPDLPQTASFHSDKNNIAPRLGFAVDVFGNGKTSFRGGAGVFYGRIINSTIYNALTATGNTALGPDGVTPVSQVVYTYTPTSPGSPQFPRLVPTAGQAIGPSAAFLDKNFSNPYVYQGDLNVEQSLGHNLTLTLSYLGALGRALPQFVDLNLPAPTSITYTISDPSGKGPLANGSTYTTRFYGRAPNTAASPCPSQRPNCKYGSLTNIYSGVNSSYHALVGSLSQKLTHGLEYQVNYTFSHALDNGENNSTFSDTNDVLDPLNRRGDYGNSNQNVPNRLVAYAVYTSPAIRKGLIGLLLNEYQVAPSFAIQNGLPFSAATSGTPTLFATPTSTSGTGGVGGGVNGSGGANRIDILGRNLYTQPRTQVLDLRLSKRFHLTESSNIELLIESFNLANHQNVTSVNSLAYTVSTTAASTTAGVTTPASSRLTYNTDNTGARSLFGSATNSNSNLSYSPRQVQVGARVHF